MYNRDNSGLEGECLHPVEDKASLYDVMKSNSDCIDNISHRLELILVSMVKEENVLRSAMDRATGVSDSQQPPPPSLSSLVHTDSCNLSIILSMLAALEREIG